ncbi:type II toxin-antitoxin system MqsR family toxin [Pseudescherichia sp.]|uniref:type II toxin-antitoxin system MqsR family toxin n=1 Tax=Pseudescherichia sp. TaxID=2055881 RepID=UPI00289850F7|nr:type II toxin-antitoxin system MqsR family toxin [Pseudescherichia sp.]
MAQGKEPTDLSTVQGMVRNGKVAVKISALNGANELGFTCQDEIFEVIYALKPSDFYKVMEANKDPGYWQEVYRPVYNGQWIYLKFLVKDNVVIVSFKEK